MFEYAFMNHAFIAGMVLGAAIPCIGVIVVLKRLSMMGDALSHSSLAGVAGGLIAGVDPVAGSVVACLAAAELAIAIVMSCGVGLAGVLSGFVPSAASFSSFLFGSIVAISDDELIAAALVGAAVLGACILFRRKLFLVTLDERAARLAGVRVKAVNALFVILTALTVAVGARTVGALVVSSMMVVPVACALQVARSWKQTVAISCAVGLAITAAGLVLSFELGLKPGGTIVLVGVVLLLCIIVVKAFARQR